MLPAPDDSPKTVTRPGSPPKAAMLSCTQRSAADLVEEPAVGRRSEEVPEPLPAETVVEGHHDDAVVCQGGAVEDRIAGPAGDVAPAVDPDHHRQTGGTGVGGPDVDGQPVAVAVRRGGCAEHARLRRRRPERGGIAHAVPRLDGLRRAQAELTHRRARERHAAKHGEVVLRPSAHAARDESNVGVCASGLCHPRMMPRLNGASAPTRSPSGRSCRRDRGRGRCSAAAGRGTGGTRPVHLRRRP